MKILLTPIQFLAFAAGAVFLVFFLLCDRISGRKLFRQMAHMCFTEGERAEIKILENYLPGDRILVKKDVPKYHVLKGMVGIVVAANSECIVAELDADEDTTIFAPLNFDEVINNAV
jgi:hypothetical protein